MRTKPPIVYAKIEPYLDDIFDDLMLLFERVRKLEENKK